MTSELDIPQEMRHDFKGICWWCGARPADSKEHKYKKSDLTQAFGKGPWRGDQEVVRGGSRVAPEQTRVQGPNSDRVKFDKVLCAQCNNKESQQFDLAYSKFTTYLDSHEDEILSKRRFYFSDIYGDDWKTQRASLIRYCVKHIGCRLASYELRPPADLVNYLSSSTTEDAPHLHLTLEIRSDIVAMMEHSKEHGFTSPALWSGDLFYSHDFRRITVTSSFFGYKWLRVRYVVDSVSSTGETNFDQNLVALPEDYNIHPRDFPTFCSACNPTQTMT